MKIVPQTDTAVPSGNSLRLGIVRLGRAAGKTKYALLDEADIKLVQQFAFEAKLEVDANGMGASVYAYAYDIKKGRAAGEYVHTMLWEMHRGGIAPGWRVVHINNVTVDNRLDNLALVPVGQTTVPGRDGTNDRLNNSNNKNNNNNSSSSLVNNSNILDKERCLYWVAIAQLPVDPLEEYSFEVRERFHGNELVLGGGLPGVASSNNSSTVRSCLNRNGELEQMYECDLNPQLPPSYLFYYECRYPPCTQMEQHMRQFSICGRCQEARYCGTFCQQRDWAVHKKTCQPKQRAAIIGGSERPPER